MEIDVEALKRTFSGMDDDELLRRWHGELTDEARAVARAEVDARGLDGSQASLERLKQHDVEVKRANVQRQKKMAGRMLFRLAMMIIGTIAGVIALLVLGGR